jgi:hypothetical protein
LGKKSLFEAQIGSNSCLRQRKKGKKGIFAQKISAKLPHMVYIGVRAQIVK